MPDPTTAPPSYKRSRSYWEPIFSPDQVKDYKVFDWDTHVKGFEYGHCNAEDLKEKFLKTNTSVDRIKFEGRHFTSCDFKGDFSFCKITFSQCTFENCDFDESHWILTKFAKCTFRRCSFSTSRFDNVQFIDCIWNEMGISSGEMHLKGVLITNPEEFIKSAYTNLDSHTLSQKGTSPAYQKYRLEGTKAKASRKILTNLQGLSDDKAYYQAVKTYACQSLTARISESKYLASQNSSKIKKIFHTFAASALNLELLVLSISGRINEWGRNIGRAISTGVAIIILFWLIYEAIDAHAPHSNLLASIEITLLFGYTKYASSSAPITIQAIECINAFFGLWWYAILVPTIVNRISRVHE